MRDRAFTLCHERKYLSERTRLLVSIARFWSKTVFVLGKNFGLFPSKWDLDNASIVIVQYCSFDCCIGIAICLLFTMSIRQFLKDIPVWALHILVSEPMLAAVLDDDSASGKGHNLHTCAERSWHKETLTAGCSSAGIHPRQSLFAFDRPTIFVTRESPKKNLRYCRALRRGHGHFSESAEGLRNWQLLLALLQKNIWCL